MMGRQVLWAAALGAWVALAWSQWVCARSGWASPSGLRPTTGWACRPAQALRQRQSGVDPIRRPSGRQEQGAATHCMFLGFVFPASSRGHVSLTALAMVNDMRPTEPNDHEERSASMAP
jgi:hypothetical protein